MTFNHPLWLLLLLLLPILFLIGPGKKRKFYGSLRLIVMSLLILSMAGPSLNLGANRTTTILLLDRSHSMNQTDSEIALILDELNAAKTPDTDLEIISFGKGPAMGLNEVDGSATNLAGAMSLAQGLYKNTNRQILLISDGLENAGDSVSAALGLGASNIPLYSYYLSGRPEDEVMMKEMNLPKYLRTGMVYNIEVDIINLSDKPQTGKLMIYKGTQAIYAGEVSLKPGENRLAVTDTAIGGSQLYRAEIQCQSDFYPQNNSLYAYAYVNDVPQVLILGHKGSQLEMFALSQATGVVAKQMDSFSAPDLASLLSYDAVVLCDVSIDDLPGSFPKDLAEYAQLGGGVLFTGGENSYGPGGYYQTELETILPVQMRLRDKSLEPDLAMVIVTDRSGSMSSSNYGVTKIDLSKEAALRSAETLSDRDYLGVLAFDTDYTWITPIANVGDNREKMLNDIASISEGGGTSILPALGEAYRELAATNAKLKHIILLTDGLAEQDGYAGLLEHIVDDNITLSCVAVGSDSDITLMKYLAEKGGGRYYYSDEFTDLPKIFAKETFLAGRSYINNRAFYPESYFHPIIEDVEYLPMLLGYVSVFEKSLADVILRSDTNEPILSVWQYGLGKVAAWASDTQNWASQWMGQNSGQKVLANTLAYVLRKNTQEGEVVLSEGNLGLKLPYYDDLESVSGRLVGSGSTVDFTLVSPGEYKGSISEHLTTGDVIEVKLNKSDGQTQTLVYGLTPAYGAEYDLSRLGGKENLNKISTTTGGRLLGDPTEIMGFKPEGGVRRMDLSRILLIAALLLFLIDVAVRRFSYYPKSVRIADKVKAPRPIIPSKIPSAPKKIENVPDGDYNKDTSDILLERKKRRGGE